MKILRRFLYREIVSAVAFATVGFLALFFFFDLVDQLTAIGRDGYTLRHAVFYALLLVPGHLYELLPITVLIGTIFVMARLAQSSEFTILRTSGLGPWRALRMLLGLGAVFVMFTFLVGDYLAPSADRSAQLLKAQFRGDITIGQTGAWLREKQPEGSFSVNVGALAADGQMRAVRIFDFAPDGRLRSITQADTASVGPESVWTMPSADRTSFAQDVQGNSIINRQQISPFVWPTDITAEMVSVALLRPERMGTIDLFSYIAHLKANGQSTQLYDIEFWKKVFYPLSCLVMVMLALPFAYLHFRSGGLATYVFGGIMVGISFFLLTNLFGYLGNLQNWQPWLTAAAPSLLYTAVSLAAFGWLVLRR